MFAAHHKPLQGGQILPKRNSPPNKLSEDECSKILDVCHQPEFAELPPSQIVPRLADEGCYLASESTFYAILRLVD